MRVNWRVPTEEAMTTKKAKKVEESKTLGKTGEIGAAVAGVSILAKDFPTREALENHVRNKYGLTVEAKKVQIVGTERELRGISLSHGSLFWGITCVAYDPPAEKVKSEIDRGKRSSFGIQEREAPKEI